MSKTPAPPDVQQTHARPSKNKGGPAPPEEALSRDDWLTSLLQIMTAPEATAIAVYSRKLLHKRSGKRGRPK